MDAIFLPAFDPIAFAIGPIAVRWYALAYLFGFIAGWFLAVRLARETPLFHGKKSITKVDIDDFLTWAIVGVILGGRLGYVFIYNPGYYLSHPLEALYLWQGGMSFHGGLTGMVVAAICFARKRDLPTLAFGDILGVVAPIGLFFGRLANFINGELLGRVADPALVPWAVVFPNGDGQPRHPSQLYEAVLEGLVLFIILFACSRIAAIRRRPGIILGLFFLLYGIFRAIAEFFRTPDVQIGFIADAVTMGQILCLPMIAVGLWLVTRALRRGTA